MLLDATSGVELGRAAGAGYGGLVDLTLDGANTSIVSYEENDEGEGAELGRYAITGAPDAPSLGPRTRIAWVDGVSRVLATPLGLVTFQENQGQRWTLARDGSGPFPSASCPRPASVETVATNDGLRLVGVSAPFPTDEPATRFEVSIGAAGFGPCNPTAIAGIPGSARLVRLANGSELVFGVTGASLVSARVEGVHAVPLEPTGLSAESVEAAALVDGIDDVIIVLTSGPARLVAFRASASAPPGLSPPVHVDLPAEVRREQQFFSREIETASGRVFVATSDGVVAFDVSADDGEPIVRDAPFGGGFPNALRGPVVASRAAGP